MPVAPPGLTGTALGTAANNIDPWHTTDLFPALQANTAAATTTPGVWAEYKITTRLDRDSHTYMMGVTSPLGVVGNQAAFVKLAMDTVLMIVEWEGASFGNIPYLPDPTQVDARWQLLDDTLKGWPPTVSDDGVTPLYRFQGIYWYGLVNPSGFTFQDFVIPRYPWLQDVFQRAIPTTSLAGGIIQKTVATTPVPSPMPKPLSK